MPIKVQGGKEYQLVSERLVKLREKFPDAKIETWAEQTPHGVMMKAEITVEQADAGRISTGHSYCNMQGDKALEKAETTAVGRALAFLDPDLMGSEIASADEMQDFHAKDLEKRLHKGFAEHMRAVEEHWVSISAIKEALYNDSLPEALEAWRELGEDVMRTLWRAPSKGGIFTTKERALLDQASNEDFQQRKLVNE